jgi:hypothetical protein
MREDGGGEGEGDGASSFPLPLIAILSPAPLCAPTHASTCTSHTIHSLQRVGEGAPTRQHANSGKAIHLPQFRSKNGRFLR